MKVIDCFQYNGDSSAVLRRLTAMEDYVDRFVVLTEGSLEPLQIPAHMWKKTTSVEGGLKTVLSEITGGVDTDVIVLSLNVAEVPNLELLKAIRGGRHLMDDGDIYSMGDGGGKIMHQSALGTRTVQEISESCNPFCVIEKAKKNEPYYLFPFRGAEETNARWREIMGQSGLPFETEDLHYLEVGAYEGRASLFLLNEYVCKRPGNSLTCIDTFLGSVEHIVEEKTGLFERFQHNLGTSDFNAQVNVLRGLSSEGLLSSMVRKKTYCFIYIDASHEARNVLEYVVLSFPLLRKGGIMIFDDYFCNLQDPQSIHAPKIAIDSFLSCYTGSYKIVSYGYQLCVQKL